MAGASVKATAPEGMGPFSRSVFEVLARYTAFPWPILSAQCKRSGVDAMNLDSAGLAKIIPLVARGVGLFTTPEKAILVSAELARLAGGR